MAAHPQPERLVGVGRAAGRLSRAASAAAEELLDALTMVGDHGTQRSVDDAVDALVGALREVSADGAELAFVLGAQAPAQDTAPRPSGQRVERR